MFMSLLVISAVKVISKNKIVKALMTPDLNGRKIFWSIVKKFLTKYHGNRSV